jgi:hypothetical protein
MGKVKCKIEINRKVMAGLKSRQTGFTAHVLMSPNSPPKIFEGKIRYFSYYKSKTMLTVWRIIRW